MSHYNIFFTKEAVKDVQKLTPKLKEKLRNILTNVLNENPHLGKSLTGDLKGNYSYRLNIKDRIVYSIDESKKAVYIKRARSHYGD